jgi:hypothetical protein
MVRLGVTGTRMAGNYRSRDPSLGSETCEVVEIPRPSRGALHRDEMVKAADSPRDSSKFARYGLGVERVVARLGFDAGDPLHDV